MRGMSEDVVAARPGRKRERCCRVALGEHADTVAARVSVSSAGALDAMGSLGTT